MEIQNKNIIKSTSSLFLVQIGNYVVPMISIPIIVRIIGPDKFGMINYASAIIMYFFLLINYGFNLTATRKIAQLGNNSDIRNSVFSEVLGSKIFLFFISCLIFAGCLVVFPVFQKDIVLYPQ